jgi:SAM-dependent methyltransferase
MRLIRRIFFNAWYYFNPPWDTGISPPELMQFIESHAPGRALDMGCGTGTNVITLAKHGWQVTGVDFAGKAIKRARRKARQAQVDVDLRVHDVTHLQDLQGPFDLVLDIGCFHSLDDAGRRAYMDALDGLLASDGTFLLYAFFKQDAEQNGPGLENSAFELLSSRLELVARTDGSERGRQPSAWLTYQKAAPKVAA